MTASNTERANTLTRDQWRKANMDAMRNRIRVNRLFTLPFELDEYRITIFDRAGNMVADFCAADGTVTMRAYGLIQAEHPVRVKAIHDECIKRVRQIAGDCTDRDEVVRRFNEQWVQS